MLRQSPEETNYSRRDVTSDVTFEIRETHRDTNLQIADGPYVRDTETEGVATVPGRLGRASRGMGR